MYDELSIIFENVKNALALCVDYVILKYFWQFL